MKRESGIILPPGVEGTLPVTFDDKGIKICRSGCQKRRQRRRREQRQNCGHCGLWLKTRHGETRCPIHGTQWFIVEPSQGLAGVTDGSQRSD